MTVMLIVHTWIRPEFIQQYKEELVQIRHFVMGEKQCQSYEFAQTVEDPSEFVIWQVWPSRAYFEAFQLHRPYYTLYVARTRPWWQKPRRLEWVSMDDGYVTGSSSSSTSSVYGGEGSGSVVSGSGSGSGGSGSGSVSGGMEGSGGVDSIDIDLGFVFKGSSSRSCMVVTGGGEEEQSERTDVDTPTSTDPTYWMELDC